MSDWQKGGIRVFLKANQGSKGTDFKLFMNSDAVRKWIINIQSKRENRLTHCPFTMWQTPIYPLKPTADTSFEKPAVIPQIEFISPSSEKTSMIALNTLH